MALGDIYTEQEVDEKIDQLLPVFNSGRPADKLIPRDLVRTFARAENMGNTGGVTFANRTSPVGASGVMQVMPTTIQGLKKTKHLAPDFPEDLSDAPLDHQVLAGMATIREMVDRTGTTDWKTLAKHYNGGTAVGNGTKPMSKETEGYLIKGQRARMAMGIEDTPLPPTVASGPVTPSPAFKTSPLDQAQTAYQSMMMIAPQLQSALFGSNVAAQESGRTQQQAVLLAGEAAANAARTQAEITIGENDFHRRLLTAVGLDIENPESKLNAELGKEAKTRVQREALEKRIVEMEQVDFFSNPLKFLMVQPELKGAVSQYNQLANTENRSTSEIARMQSLATTIKSLTPAKSADLLRAKASADATQLVEKAKFDAATISANTAAGSAKSLLDQFTLRRNIFHDILQIESREEGIKDKAWNQNFRQLQFDALLDERNAKRKDKELADSQEMVLVTGINLYSKAITGNNVELTKEDIKKMPANIRGAWYEVMLRGNYGNDYAEAVPFIKTFGNAANAANTGNAALMQVVRNIEARVPAKAAEIRNQHNAVNPMAPMSEKAAMSLALNKLYTDDAILANKGADKNIISAGSPYALDYEAITKAAAKNPTTSVAKVLVAQQQRNPNVAMQMTPRALVEQIKARVVAGEIDPKIAAQEIAGFYKQANDQQYESGGLKYIGLPEFKDFVITPGQSGTRKVDLYNPAQIENYLTAEVAKEKRLITFGGFSGSANNVQQPFGMWR